VLSKSSTSSAGPTHMLRTMSEPATPGNMKDGHFYLLALADLQKWGATEQQMKAAKTAVAANDKEPQIEKYPWHRSPFAAWYRSSLFAVQAGAMFEADRVIKINEAGEDGNKVEWQFYRLKQKQYTRRDGETFLEDECWVSNYPWLTSKDRRHATEFQGKDIQIRALGQFEYQARTSQLESAKADFESKSWFTFKMGLLFIGVPTLFWWFAQWATAFDLTEAWRIPPPPQNNGPEWDALCPDNGTVSAIYSPNPTEWQDRYVTFTADKGTEFRQYMRWQPSQKGLQFNRGSRLTGVAREVGEALVQRTQAAAVRESWFSIITTNILGVPVHYWCVFVPLCVVDYGIGVLRTYVPKNMQIATFITNATWHVLFWFLIVFAVWSVASWTMFINVHQYWRCALVSIFASYLLKEVASTIREFAWPFSRWLFLVANWAYRCQVIFVLSCLSSFWMFFHILPPARTVEMCRQFRECFKRHSALEEPCCCPDFGEGTWISDLLSSANWKEIDAANLENTAWQRIIMFLTVTSQTTNFGKDSIKAVKDFWAQVVKQISKWAQKRGNYRL
jgi:hypothetical protein